MLEIRFPFLDKVHEYAGRWTIARLILHIPVQNFPGIPVEKIEIRPVFNPYGARLDLDMRHFTNLHIGKSANDTIMGRCQIDGGKRLKKASLRRRPMNIGIMHGHGIIDKKHFQTFRIMRIIVNQGFDQKTVLDADGFILMHRYHTPIKFEQIAFGFEFIPPDVAFVKNGMIHPAFSQKITSGQTGMNKVKIEGMMGCYSVKRIKFDQLTQGNGVSDIGLNIKIQLPEVNGNSLGDAVDQMFDLLHGLSSP